MRFINTLHEGETIRGIYLCKTKRTAETRNGKPYDNLLLQDKTASNRLELLFLLRLVFQVEERLCRPAYRNCRQIPCMRPLIL